jgi:uncharacterized protein (TIGR02996 family)
MTTDRGAELLAQVYAAPDDDAPRLVYADWLQQHGDPLRGELIALQIERARGRARSGGRQREKELLAAHGQSWTKSLELPTWTDEGDVRQEWITAGCRFGRGFPEAVVANTYGRDPMWSTVRQCNVPPRSDDCHAGALRVVTDAQNADVLALAKLVRPLAIEELAWGHVASPTTPGFEHAIATITPEAIWAFQQMDVLPALRRLELSPVIVGAMPTHEDVSWAWSRSSIEELLVPGDPLSTAIWLDTITKTRLKRFELACRCSLGGYAWQLAMRLVFERDASGRFSRLTALVTRTSGRILARLGEGLSLVAAGTLETVRIAIGSQAWTKTAAERTELMQILEGLKIEATIEKATR